MAAHWDEEPNETEPVTAMTVAKQIKTEKKNLRMRELKAAADLKAKTEAELLGGLVGERANTSTEEEMDAESDNSGISSEGDGDSSGNSAKQKASSKAIREHINLCKARMRNDPRPIDSTCGCYTCKGFSRAYLHHLFKARETLGGTLVSKINCQ